MDMGCIDMENLKKVVVQMKRNLADAEDRAESAEKKLKSVTDERDDVSSFIHVMHIYCRFLMLLTD